jgi:hypothetical protein
MLRDEIRTDISFLKGHDTIIMLLLSPGIW